MEATTEAEERAAMEAAMMVTEADMMRLFKESAAFQAKADRKLEEYQELGRPSAYRTYERYEQSAQDLINAALGNSYRKAFEQLMRSLAWALRKEPEQALEEVRSAYRLAEYVEHGIGKGFELR